LRERREDILALARHFVNVYSTELGRDGLVLTQEHNDILLAHAWPGNVRELQNVIERAVIKSAKPPLRIDLPVKSTERVELAADLTSEHPRPSFCTVAELRKRERDNIVAALTESGWRVGGKGGAAQLLGLRPSTLRGRMDALRIRRP